MKLPSALFARRHHRPLLTTIAALVAVSPALRAANIWDGGGADGNWSTVVNWDDDQLPAFPSGITFAGVANLVADNDLENLTVGGIVFDFSADAFVLGGNAVTLAGNITNNSISPQTINLPMALGAAVNVDVAFGSALTVGPGANGTGVISGSFGLTKAGSGTLHLAAANTYTGTTTLDGGTLAYAADNTVSALHFGIVPTAANASFNTSTLDLSGGSLVAGSLAVQTNSGAPNTITIGENRALAVNGAFTVGIPNIYTDNFAGVSTNLMVTGGGTLAVTSGTGHFSVALQRANAPGGADPNATVDLSGLSHFIFTATTGELRVAAGNASGTLRLANTSNTITAAQIQVGNTGTGGGNNGATGILVLGAGTNEFRVNNINVGITKGRGDIMFQSGTGSITITGQAGGASTANITVGDGSNATGSGGTSQFLLDGHMATIQAGTVRVGQTSGSASGNGGFGSMSFDTGTFDVNSMILASNVGSSSSATATPSAVGTLTIGGAFPNTTATGVFNVHSEFLLANRTVTVNPRSVTGNFIINGGTANINADILIVDASFGAAARTTTLTLAGGTLNMMGHSIGTAALPVDNVNLPFFGQTATLANLGGTGINGAGLSFTNGGTLVLEGTNTYLGPTTIGTGTLQVGTGGDSGTLGSGPIANDGALVFNRAGTVTVAGAITGAGSIVKQGDGLVILAGANNYTGATSIEEGALALVGTAGEVTLSPGAILHTGFDGGLDAASLVVNGGELQFDFDATGPLINVTGSATFNGASTIRPDIRVEAGTHSLVSAGIMTLGAQPSLVAPAGTRKTFALDFTTPNVIDLVVTGASKFLEWTGSNNGVWNTGAGATQNWTDGAIAETFFQADGVAFRDGPANRAITIPAGTMLPDSVLVENGLGNDYRISGDGSIGGTAGLVKDGAGALSLATANTYTGGTQLIAGTLNLEHETALGSGPLVIEGGALGNTSGAPVVMTANNPQTWNGDFTFSGPSPLSLGTGVVTLGGDRTVTIANSSLTVGGTIQGAFTLTKAGEGTLIFTGANNVAATNIAEGILQVGDGGASGSLGPGAVENAGVLRFNLSADHTVAASISGAGNIVQAGPNIVTLAGVNSYTGTTFINAGRIRVTSNNSLGALSGEVIVADGAALDLSGNPTAQALNFGAKQFVIEGTGPDELGAIVNFGVSQFNALQHVKLTDDATVGGTARFDIRSVPTSALAATLDLAGHTLTKIGTNDFGIVGTDVSDGNIVVNQGTFGIESVSNIPDFGTGTKITMNAGTTLRFFNNTAPVSTVLRPIVFNGPGIQMGNNNNANSVIGSPMTLNGDVTVVTLNNNAANTLTLTGVIGETTPHSLTKTGVGTLVLTGNNTFTGGMVIDGGIVQAQSATALGAAGSPLVVNTGGTLQLVSHDLTVGPLSGTGGTITNSGASALTLVTDTADDTTFAGAIVDGSSSIGLHKRGAGSLTLTGASAYSGTTVVEAGGLVVNGSLTGSTIVDGGILSGAGTVGAAALIDGSIAPGAGIGLLTTSSLSLEGGTLAFDLDGAAPGTGAGFHDQLRVFGFVNITAPVALALNFAAYNPVDEVDSFVLVNNDGIDAVNRFGLGALFTYNGLDLEEGMQFTAVSGEFTQAFSITYAGGDSGNDIVLHAVPEPGAAAALLGGMGVLAALRRPRRKH